MQRLCVLICISINLLVFLGEPAIALSGCGDFEFWGYIRKEESKIVLKLYEKSMSETTLELSESLQDLSNNKIDQAVVVKASLNKPLRFYRGSIEATPTKVSTKQDSLTDLAPSPIQLRTPNPVSPNEDSKIVLMNERPCKI
ncbi:MAG: hypothetical protein RJB66_1314 [Pseudomonadota bacterium]|jgi:hypothetical protein